MGAKPTRRPTSLASREKWQAALDDFVRIEARATGDDIVSEFLPKLVAALRAKGYGQKQIVDQILQRRLGVSDRAIRSADRDVRKAQGGSSRGLSRDAAGTRHAGVPSAGSGMQPRPPKSPPHAGFHEPEL
jgi:hypothetical protein